MKEQIKKVCLPCQVHVLLVMPLTESTYCTHVHVHVEHHDLLQIPSISTQALCPEYCCTVGPPNNTPLMDIHVHVGVAFQSTDFT